MTYSGDHLGIIMNGKAVPLYMRHVIEASAPPMRLKTAVERNGHSHLNVSLLQHYLSCPTALLIYQEAELSFKAKQDARGNSFWSFETSLCYAHSKASVPTLQPQQHLSGQCCRPLQHWSMCGPAVGWHKGTEQAEMQLRQSRTTRTVKRI